LVPSRLAPTTIVEATFDAKRVERGQPAVIRPARGEGTRPCPSASTRRSWRTGARATMRVYQLAELTIGAGLGVADG
jgi:hypothetical protein